MFTAKFQIKSALVYFLIAAFFGVVLRMTDLIDLPLEYRHIVHGHSHIALLGWAYVAMIAILSKLYLVNPESDKQYKWILSLTHISIIGMMIAFPFQGYALVSIIFSSLFIVFSYWFIIYFIKNTPKERKTFSFKVIRVALLLFVLSSAGPWSLGAIVSTLGANSVWYKMAIYFYLHFLYNGAYILFLVGLLLRVFEDCKVELSRACRVMMLRLFLAGLFLAFLLSVLYAEVPLIVNIAGIIGGVLQLVFFLFLISLVRKHWGELVNFQSKLIKPILIILAGFILMKCVLQILSGMPFFTDLTVEVYDFIIAYLHLVFLGIISVSLLIYMKIFQLIDVSKSTFVLFLEAVIISEGLLIYRGICEWLNLEVTDQFDSYMIGASAMIPISLLLLLIQSLRKESF